MIKVIGNKVLIRPDESEVEKQAKAAGLALPEKHNEKSSQGTVLNVGPGKWESGKLIPMEIGIGDTVFYSRTFAQPVKMDGRDLVVIKEDDILLAVGTSEPERNT